MDTSSNAVSFLSRGWAAKRTEAAALFTGADELAKALSFVTAQDGTIIRQTIEIIVLRGHRLPAGILGGSASVVEAAALRFPNLHLTSFRIQ